MRRGSLLCRVVFGIPVTLIDPQHPQRFFARDNMYDYEDDFERCALLHLQSCNSSGTWIRFAAD
jgi:hypothetical protein